MAVPGIFFVRTGSFFFLRNWVGEQYVYIYLHSQPVLAPSQVSSKKEMMNFAIKVNEIMYFMFRNISIVELNMNI